MSHLTCKKVFFFGVLGVFLSPEAFSSPYKNRGSIYELNPQWQEFHKFPSQKNQKSSPSLPLFRDPTMLSFQQRTLKDQADKEYEQLHQSGLMTGLYRKQLEKDYAEKNSQLRQIASLMRSQKRDWGASFRPMNPLNSITRSLVVNTDQGQSSFLYRKHR